MMKNKHRITFKKSYFLWMVCLVAFGFLSNVHAQNLTITGNITDETNSPLPGANVVIKGTTSGTTSDFDGNYSIDNVAADGILIFSFVGYTTKEVSVNGQTTINVSLEPDAQTLGEVVVVGYGTERRSQITGAVASVSPEAITRAATATLDNALQGLTAGVSVATNNAQPGGGISVRIRGAGGVNASEPLYVVDGFPITAPRINDNDSELRPNSENSSPLTSINPQDIKSITVLKDAASAAIYGTRAANGVVLITTKRGRRAQKGVVTVSARAGFQRIANTLDLMDAQTYVATTNLARQNAGLDMVPGFENPASFGAGTDWIETITRSAPVSDITVSFTGGSEKSNFFMSLGRFQQDGIVKGSEYERVSMRLNADNRISEKLKVGTSIAYTRSKQQGLGRSRGTNTTLSYATLMYPTVPVFDENGDFAPTPANGFYKPSANPLFTAEAPYQPPINSRFQGNIYAQLDVLPNLQFKTTGYLTFNNIITDTHGRIFDLGAAASTEEDLVKAQETTSSYIIENILNYNISLDNHSIGLLLGHTFQQDDRDLTRLTAENPVEGGLRAIDENTQNLRVFDIFTDSNLLSFFGKVNYSFQNKYLLTAIVRRDGSSRFGANNKWGTFPSVSVGWNISNEDFISKDGALSSLKLRAGWGQVGFDGIGPYDYSAPVESGFNYPFDNANQTTGFASRRIANPDLRWETVTQYSVGIDADFLDDRLNIVAEYYNKTQEDMLVPVPQSAVTGLSQGRGQQDQRQNIGELTNKGIEFTVNYTGNIGELKYAVGANFTTIDNEIVDIPAPISAYGRYSGTNLTRTENGRSLGEFYGLVADGIFQNDAEVAAHAFQDDDTAPGDIRYLDLNGDGVIDTDGDRTFIGNPHPTLTYGFNINLEYKNFDFALQGTGVSGNDVFNISKAFLTDYTRSENKLNITPWSVSNPTPNPRAIAQDVGNSDISSFYVEDGSFTRIKVIELGYSIPAKVLEKLKISRIRIYGNVQNAFTFTKYSGYDPEVGNSGGDNLAAGIDNFVYPVARTFSIGLNASF